jgi:hypothetical protein
MQSPIAADSSGPIILIQPRAGAENADGIILDLMPETPLHTADRLSACKKRRRAGRAHPLAGESPVVQGATVA